MLLIEKGRPAAKNLTFSEHTYDGTTLACAQIQRPLQKDMAFSNNIDPIFQVTLSKNVISGGIGFQMTEFGDFQNFILLESLEKITAF
jgi:hypothetical protein